MLRVVEWKDRGADGCTNGGSDESEQKQQVSRALILILILILIYMSVRLPARGQSGRASQSESSSHSGYERECLVRYTDTIRERALPCPK